MSNPSNSPKPAETGASPVSDVSTAASRTRLVVGTVVFGVALFFGLRYLADAWARESTDDAFVDGHVVAIASRVPGQVLATHVAENQGVKAGDPLVEIDPRDFEIRVAQKRAALQGAQANQHAIEAGFELMRARVTTAEAVQKQSAAEAEAAKSTFQNAEATWTRARNLWTNLSHDVMSDQDYENAQAAMNTAKANWQADVQKSAGDISKIAESHAQLTTAEKFYEQAGAQISQAEADLRAAELELSYTKIMAPVDGRITRKMVEKGAYVQTGQNLLAIVRPEIWVTANFKETQTARIRAGQPVEITVDGMKDGRLRGKVDSLQSGSGARFSLLPPENAVGNYVKVVQRVPVKIVFDDPLQAAQGLGPGMSVLPSVEVGRRFASDPVIAAAAVIMALAAGIVFGWFMRRRQKNPPPT